MLQGLCGMQAIEQAYIQVIHWCTPLMRTFHYKTSDYQARSSKQISVSHYSFLFSTLACF